MLMKYSSNRLSGWTTIYGQSSHEQRFKYVMPTRLTRLFAKNQLDVLTEYLRFSIIPLSQSASPAM